MTVQPEQGYEPPELAASDEPRRPGPQQSAYDIGQSDAARSVERGRQILDEVLLRAGLFQGVDPKDAAVLSGQFETVIVDQGKTVFREGQPGDSLYVVIEGKVKLGKRSGDGRENLVAIMGPSDQFGELSLFDPGPRTTTATAIVDSRLARLPKEALHHWVRVRPQIAVQLLQVVARRLRRTNTMMTDLIFVDVSGRVAKQLLHLAQQFGTVDGDQLWVNHDLTQQELAQLVGGSRETVNKTLSEFAARGWLRVEGKSVVILDPQRLIRRAR